MGKKICFRSYKTIKEIIEKCGSSIVEGEVGTTENISYEIKPEWEGMLMFDIGSHLDVIKKEGFIVRETAQDIEIVHMKELTDKEKIEIIANDLLNGKSTFIIRHEFSSKTIEIRKRIETCTNKDYLIFDYDKDTDIERITIDDAIEACKTKNMR